MQRFHVTLLLVTLISLATVGFIVTNVSPYTTEGIVDTPIVLLLLAGIWFGVT